MPGGYIKLYYQIDEWRYWDRPYYTQVWIHILMKVNWKEVAYKYGEKLGPGETIITLRGFSEECGISKSTLARILADLEAEKQIETTLRQGRTFIKVLNYAVFQGSNKKAWDKRKDTDQDIGEDISEDISEDTPVQYIKRNKEHKNIRTPSEANRPLTAEEMEELEREIEEETRKLKGEK